MNSIQKLYEIRSRMPYTTQRVPISEYFKNLGLIRTRRNQFIFPQDKTAVKKFVYEPFKDPFIKEANKKHKLKIFSILAENPLPKINDVFLEVRKNMKNSKEKYRKMAERALSVENLKFEDSIFSQRPRVPEFRKLRKNYTKKHRRYNKIMKYSRTKYNLEDDKKNQSKYKNLVLPDINGNNNKTEKLFQTEINTNNNSLNDKSTKIPEKMKEHKHEEIPHEQKGKLEG